MNYLSNLWNALDFGSMLHMLLRVISVLLCLILHETCHGLVACALGDPTAKMRHRLSLNPLRHIDWLGLASMLFAGVGWAKPVPVNPNYFKKPKQGMALTALAGPVSNFLLAFLLILFMRVDIANGRIALSTWDYFLLSTAMLSIGLGLFNLIPIPPLDGSKILAAFLPDRAYNWLMHYERYGMIVVILLMSLGVVSDVLNRVIVFVFTLFCRIVSV